MKTPVEGVYSSRQPGSWPFARPRTMVDLLPQLIDCYRPKRRYRVAGELRTVVDALHRDGVAILENAVPPGLIEAARRDMDRLVERMPELQGTIRTKPASTGGTRDYPVHEHQQDLKVYRSHDPLVFSPAFAGFLLLPALTGVAAGYLGENWLYQAMIATRTEARDPTREGFAQWHHDARGRKLNVILLLTDVSDDGSATQVLAGSHRLVYSRARRHANFFDDGEVDALQRVHGWRCITCSAPAGSLVFFDSQSLHLGRRARQERDAFQVNLMTRRSHLWPQEIPARVLDALDPSEQNLLLDRARLSVV